MVIGTTGRVTCEHVQANTVIVAGALRGNISAEKVEIRSTGRVWGDVKTGTFTTEEGAFLRGQIQMEERVELDIAEEKEDEVSDSEIILQPVEKVEAAPTETKARKKPVIIDEPLKPKTKPKSKSRKAKKITPKSKPKKKSAKKTAKK